VLLVAGTVPGRVCRAVHRLVDVRDGHEVLAVPDRLHGDEQPVEGQ
jgi:hypothetical protein